MPGKSYSRPQRFAAVMLARQAGTVTASKVLGIDPETVAKWLDTVEIPSSEWGAVEALLLARGSEMSATGVTTGLVQTLTAAGIAARNRRYEQLVERADVRRELSVEPEPDGDPEAAWHAALRDLSRSRKRLLSAELRAERAARADDPVLLPSGPDPDPDAMLAFIERLAAVPDEEIEARLAAVQRLPLLGSTHLTPQNGQGGEREAAVAPDPVTGALVAGGTPEALRARLAKDVSPGATPLLPPVPHPPTEDLVEPSDAGQPWQWTERGRWEQ